MKDLFQHTSNDISKLLTQRYSTSFTLGTRLFAPKDRPHIYNLYGLVRLADEIVDTFHHLNQEKLIHQLEQETYEAIEQKFSYNLILNAFQYTFHLKKFKKSYVEAFFESMKMDLTLKKHSQASYEQYIYGSAEVIGLMCLHVFVDAENTPNFEAMKSSAQALGAAFQKINFLRDINDDFMDKGRVYFPEVEFETFNQKNKLEIVEDIDKDLKRAEQGIADLPHHAQKGVKLALIYYKLLLAKLDKASPSLILKQRYRINNFLKIILFIKIYFF